MQALSEACQPTWPLHWWQVLGSREPAACRMPPGVLEMLCRHLDHHDLLSMRLACKAWQAVPTRHVTCVDIPLPSKAAELTHIVQHLNQVFSNVSCITLSGLDRCVLSGCAATAAPTVRSFSQLVNALSGLAGLSRLILQAFPVLPKTSPNAPSWRLPCLCLLRKLDALDLRLSAKPIPGANRATMQAAQDELLRGLSHLTQLISLRIELIDLTDVPAHQLNAQAQLLQPPAEEGADAPVALEAALEHALGAAAAAALEPDVLHNIDLDFNEPYGVHEDAPDVRCFTPHINKAALGGLKLQQLHISNVTMRHAAVTALLRSQPQLHTLSLQGRLGWSHASTQALQAMKQLQELSLGQVQLIYTQGDCEDSPQLLMGALYQTLQELPCFSKLRFILDELDETHFMHSAYLLGLYDHDDLAVKLRGLDLGTVIFDSDYSIGILAVLTNLTSLKAHFQTWPLSLQPHDLQQLCSLTALRSLHLLCSPAEQHHLLGLTPHVVGYMATSLSSLTSLHYRGLLVGDTSSAWPQLASWSSLRDLSLTYTSDINRPGDSHPAQQLPGTEVDGWLNAAMCSRQQGFRIDLARSLPLKLQKLALHGIHVDTASMEHVATHLTNLTSLQLLDCGTTPLHLLLLADGPGPVLPLEVLIMYEQPGRRTAGKEPCQDGQASNANGVQSSDGSDDSEGGSSYSYSSSGGSFASFDAADFEHEAPQHSPAAADSSSIPAGSQSEHAASHDSAAAASSSKPESTRGLCGQHTSTASVPPQQVLRPAALMPEPSALVGQCLHLPQANATSMHQPFADKHMVGACGLRAHLPVSGAADAQAVARLALQLLGNRFHGLQFLMLSLLQDVDLKCDEVLGPLCHLSRLKALTMHAHGSTWAASQVAQVLQGKLPGVRSLHIGSHGSMSGVTDALTEQQAGGPNHPYLQGR